MSHLLLSPLTWALLGLFVLALLPRASVRTRQLSWLVVAIAVTATTPFGANLLLQPLEAWARDAASKCDKALAGANVSAIALSGGFDREALDPADIAALSHSSYARGVHAAALYRSGAVEHLYVSGGAKDHETPEAAVMATLLQHLGVSRNHLTVEPTAQTTWANATALSALMRSQNAARPARLVTSAMHMPRATLAFRTVGMNVCPAPTDWQHNPLSLTPGYFIPQRSSVAKAERAFHEWVGLAAYWVRGQWARQTGESLITAE